MASAPTQLSSRWSNWGRQNAGRLLFELLIVFVGVTAAFVVDGWRAGRTARVRTDQIAHALRTDLAEFAATTRRFVEQIDSGLTKWDSTRAADREPPPFFYRIPGSERPPVGVWQAALASGVAESIEPRLLFDLAYLYSEIEGVGARYARYNAFTEQEILPRLKDENPKFYDPVTGELQAAFAAHMDRLKEIRTWMRQQATMAAGLADRLGGE